MANSQVPASQTFATQKVFVKSAEGKDFAGAVSFGNAVDVASGATLSVKSGGAFATNAGSTSTLAGVVTVPSGATLSVAAGATLSFFGGVGINAMSVGSCQAVATDLATTTALANSMRAQLVALGIIKGSA